MLVCDKQTNAAQMSATDVMDAGATTDIEAFRKLQFVRRFQVLWSLDRIIKIHNVNEGASNLFSQNGDKFKFKINKHFSPPLVVNCKDVNGVVADVTDNSLHLIGISSISNTTISHETRIRFTD